MTPSVIEQQMVLMDVHGHFFLLELLNFEEGAAKSESKIRILGKEFLGAGAGVSWSQSEAKSCDSVNMTQLCCPRDALHIKTHR